ncbi:hypothetical protein GCM10010329_31750 [Streptomyces spiroverticillatus]|uniref:DUF1700 domain-containing protein n=1 Tax=Streptomyces finlayi TaxID=67296 RepID=A0A918WW82_9ACTN|nr:hypothetical protein [Streptomyces finlayi]GHA06815.1 hypothetical protein GCM10010329_31750 [Streptomyces spiroverticillatus]GHC90284.1 hypothetical protein GCM10010334_24160 [Streptomyces finlayi]
MKTTSDLVHDYLAAVEREASALPAERRQELVADLAEHIEVTRAERPDAEVGQILAELGDPRTIAATALAEAGNAPSWGTPAPAGPPARRGKVHPVVPLLLLTLPLFVTALVPVMDLASLLCGLLRITGAVLLCTSVHWTGVQKTAGVLLTLVVPSTAVLLWQETTIAPAGDTPALVANLVMVAVVAVTAGWLWRTRRA